MNLIPNPSLRSRLKLPFTIPRWGIFAALGLALIAGPIALQLPRYTTSNSSFCLSCHGEAGLPNRGIPSKVHPGFDKVGCTECHARPDQILYEGYRKGFMSEPERISPNCQSCHPDIAKRNDQDHFKHNEGHIKIPHKLHFDQGAKCTDCHANVAHDLKNPPTNRPRMEYCAQCHAASTEACNKCHAGEIPKGPIPSGHAAGMVADGGDLYKRYCSQCHGVKGDEVVGVQLLSNEFLTAQGFNALEKMTSQGHGGMPAFGQNYGGPFTDDEIRAIIAHLKIASLGPSHTDGKALYEKNCTTCHGYRGDKMPTVNLRSGIYQQQLGDEGLVQAIALGKGNMPAWSKQSGGSLGYDEIVAIERYVVSLAQGQAAGGVPSGRNLYVQSCASCHGENGNQVPNANLGSAEFLSGRGDDALIKATAEGKGGMPPFGQAKGGPLANEGIKSIIDYLKSKAGADGAAAAPAGKGIPEIPHPLEDRQDCLACHNTGGLKPFPADHAGRNNDFCQNCHKPKSAAAAAPEAAPAPGRATAPSFTKDVLRIFQARCIGCHGGTAGLRLNSYQGVLKGGESGPAIIPGNPEGSLLIQKQAGTHKNPPQVLSPDELRIVKTWILSGAPIRPGVLPPPSALATPGVIAPPKVPHPTAGREACLACHAVGGEGVKKIPTDHAGRRDDSCRACHATDVSAPSGPMRVPHPIAGREGCLTCHETGVSGAIKIPADHAGRSNEVCLACHRPK